MQKAFSLIMAILLLTLCTGCNRNALQYSKTVINEETGDEYQQIDDYSASIIDRTEILNQDVLDWFDSIGNVDEREGLFIDNGTIIYQNSEKSEIAYADDGTGYYMYVVSSNKRINGYDVYIYWPSDKMEHGYTPDPSTFRFSIDPSDEHTGIDILFSPLSQSIDEDVYLHIHGPSNGGWPYWVYVYVDERGYVRVGSIWPS